MKEDGGPAFPCGNTPSEADGMTLRDWFAGMAMQGLIASNDVGAGDRIANIPGYAHAIADAMLEERKR